MENPTRSVAENIRMDSRVHPYAQGNTSVCVLAAVWAGVLHALINEQKNVMKRHILILTGLLCALVSMAVNPVKEGNIITGHVIEKNTEEGLPYANVLIVETGVGMATDAEGYFRFKNVPAGEYTLKVQSMGYSTQTKRVTVSNDFTVDMHFVMEEETIMTDEVVVSANRNETNRKLAPVVVNVMNNRLFEIVNSNDLAKSLNFQSGLRVENNCQNCGFPQVRINGLEGPYSQILINSRPVMSALSGVYGLEQIPTNMIERVAVRGKCRGRNHQHHHQRPGEQFVSGIVYHVEPQRKGVGAIRGCQCLAGVV